MRLLFWIFNVFVFGSDEVLSVVIAVMSNCSAVLEPELRRAAVALLDAID